VAKAWDVQVTRVLEASLEENLLMIKETVEYFKVRESHAAPRFCIGGL
jgi:isopropylmalate/homocitrate/citramalate synthase